MVKMNSFNIVKAMTSVIPSGVKMCAEAQAQGGGSSGVFSAVQGSDTKGVAALLGVGIAAACISNRTSEGPSIYSVLWKMATRNKGSNPLPGVDYAAIAVARDFLPKTAAGNVNRESARTREGSAEETSTDGQVNTEEKSAGQETGKVWKELDKLQEGAGKAAKVLQERAGKAAKVLQERAGKAEIVFNSGVQVAAVKMGVLAETAEKVARASTVVVKGTVVLGAAALSLYTFRKGCQVTEKMCVEVRRVCVEAKKTLDGYAGLAHKTVSYVIPGFGAVAGASILVASYSAVSIPAVTLGAGTMPVVAISAIVMSAFTIMRSFNLDAACKKLEAAGAEAEGLRNDLGQAKRGKERAEAEVQALKEELRAKKEQEKERSQMSQEDRPAPAAAVPKEQAQQADNGTSNRMDSNQHGATDSESAFGGLLNNLGFLHSLV
ncbi:MAG: hypothetical protein SP4CHLAM5_08700 [Chlamydiia bacterium]|nr:hypothetical protein [Chlamydiia bacterium]MCH9618733.1 hypothetical protein [Chlamydiia bacterium]MCH9624527.1 hypothetical protein [Chlamydiia bacterium]